ncbi:c-type cytochrome [Chitinilyticum piscinae]|nr:cytochrome c [Chitinilyticum piscinae]
MAAIFALAACGDEESTPRKQRKPIFKDMLRQSEFIYGSVNGKDPFDPQKVAAAATALQQLAAQPWPLYAELQNPQADHANARIVQAPEEFRRKAAELQRQASALAAVTRSGNPELIRPAIGQLQQSCTSCHDQFRKRGN